MVSAVYMPHTTFKSVCHLPTVTAKEIPMPMERVLWNLLMSSELVWNGQKNWVPGPSSSPYRGTFSLPPGPQALVSSAVKAHSSLSHVGLVFSDSHCPSLPHSLGLHTDRKSPSPQTACPNGWCSVSSTHTWQCSPCRSRSWWSRCTNHPSNRGKGRCSSQARGRWHFSQSEWQTWEILCIVYNPLVGEWREIWGIREPP